MWETYMLVIFTHQQRFCIYKGAFPAKAFLSASEQHPSPNNTTYMRKASVVSVSENESTAKDLSGDGKADSPGHSAKYGSYTVIDISCNK